MMKRTIGLGIVLLALCGVDRTVPILKWSIYAESVEVRSASLECLW